MSELAWLGVVVGFVAALWIAAVFIAVPDKKAVLRAGLRSVGNWLATLALLALATASAGGYVESTARHDFQGQIYALISGAAFLWWGIRRIAEDVAKKESK